ncbi:transposase [Mesorhizobium loti]|uniref:Transposase n=1 Tax=Rhizobium loti TaxID=381 RepID=A0A8E3B1R9_RHILI|nr:transposase [Mesorhizobium loti]
MTRSLRADLRGRVIAAIEVGVSTREATRRFRIGISTAGEARKQGQPSRSKLDAHEAFIPGLIEDAPDITLAEIGERLAAERGVRAASSTVRLYLDRRGITFQKKTAHAAEQQRPNVLRRCRTWFDGQIDLDPERLIFINETAASTKMARLRGRSLRGERLSGGRSSRPLEDHHIHGRPAAGRLGGANTARWPYQWFCLPRLRAAGPRTRASPRRHGVMDNLPAHKISGAREVIEQVGAAPVPAAILARLQPDRDGFLEAQGSREKGCNPNHRRILVGRGQLPRSFHSRGMQALFRGRRL